jgi:hypothetical protein
MKAQRWSEVITYEDEQLVSHPGSFTPERSIPNPLNGKIGEPQRGPGHFGEESSPLPIFEPQIIQPVS